MKRYLLFIICCFASLVSYTQKVENLRFEQVGKQIIIYYDLTDTRSRQIYDIQVFCSTDGGKTFSGPLQKISGAIGKSITAGTNKKATWDVLSEREKLVGDILFEIQVKNSVPTITDIEGNVYKIVTIGTQVWMAENLKTTINNDGTPIPNITDNAAWTALFTPGYCWYNNDAATYKATYGALYNWDAVNSRELCPAGWHVPSDAEWKILTTYLGGESVAGGKLKETATTNSTTANEGATNEIGFTALSGGSRSPNGTYLFIEIYGKWWSSTEYTSADAWYWATFYSNDNVYRLSHNKQFGFSVRCLRNF